MRTKTMHKKLLALLLSLVMVLGMLPMTAITAFAEEGGDGTATHDHNFTSWENQADGSVLCTCAECNESVGMTTRDVMLGTSAFTDPVDTNDDPELWDYAPTSFVYFGNKTYSNFYTGPILWQVQRASNNVVGDPSGMLLLSRYTIESTGMGFNGMDVTIGHSDWSQGRILQGCNRLEEGGFEPKELDAIQRITYQDDFEPKEENEVNTIELFGEEENPMVWYETYLNDDQLFALSVPEFCQFISNCSTSVNSPAPVYGWDADGRWVLRSPTTYGIGVAAVGMLNCDELEVHESWVVPHVASSGTIDLELTTHSSRIRPAMNLDKSQVLFAVAEERNDTRNFTDLPAGQLVTTPGYDGDTWCVALLDESREFAVAETSLTGSSDTALTINYTGAGYGSDENLFAFVTAEDSDDILYYGRIKQMLSERSPNGTATFTIPEDMPSGSYTLKVSSVQGSLTGIYRSRLTKFASAFAEIPLTVNNELYDVTVTSEGSGTASADPAEARVGTTVTIEATANDGYRFKEWQIVDGDISLSDQYSAVTEFIMPAEPVGLRAVFEEIVAHSITVTSDGSGTASADAEEACAGVTVHIEATANDGYRFKEWQIVSGGISLSDPYSAATWFTMPDAPVSLRAVFEEIAIPNITLTSNGNGKVATTNGATPAVGEMVHIYARANEGYFFKKWQVVSGNVSLSDQYSAVTEFIMPAEPVELRAIFEEYNTLSIILPTGTRTQAVHDGGSYSLDAPNRVGKGFARWNIVSGDAEIDYPTNSFCWLTVHSGDVTVEAVYEDAYQVMLVYDSSMGYAYASREAALVGEYVYLGVGTNTNFVLNEWVVIEGDVDILENDEPGAYYPYYFIMPEGNVVLRAEFDKDPNVDAYKVNLITEGKGSTSTWPDGYIEPGETVCLYDNPSEGYVLSEFRVMSGGVTIDEYGEFVMPNNDVTIKAIYERDPEFEGSLLLITADSDLRPSYETFNTTEGRRFVWLNGAYNYSGKTFFKEWQVIEGDSVELGDYTIDYSYDGETYTGVTRYGFYVPENEDVEVRAVAYPFVHYVHNWQYESLDENCHRQYCDCGVSVERSHNTGSGVVIQEATHTRDGIKRYFCNDCDGYRDEIIERIPEHQFDGWSPFCTICGAIQAKANNVTSDAGTSTTTVKERVSEQLILPASILSTVAEGNSLVLEMQDADVALSDGAVATVKSQSGDLDITVQVSGDEALTAAQKSGIPTEYNNSEMVVVSITASVGGSALHELGGNASITVPYDFSGLAPEEYPIVYYIDDDGTATLITDVVCDRVNGTVTFTTDHFSDFVIAKVGSAETAIDISISNTASATITAPTDGWKEGTNTFTVSNDAACYAAVSYDGGSSYTRLAAVAAGDGYSFTVDNVDADTQIAVGLVGDVNGDGQISNADIGKLSVIYSGKTPASTALMELLCDVNNDGDITNADTARLKVAYAGKRALDW